MKKSLTILALCLYSIMNAQDLTDWQVGINLNPFIFSRIANNVISDKNNNNLPNGFGFGLTLEKNWNDNWGIKTGLEFSTQTQKYSFDCPCDNDFESKVKYTYYKTPIAIQYQFPVSSESYLNFNQGLQVSFLNDYQYIREDNYQKFVTTNEYYQSFFYANPEYNQKINK